MVVEFLVAVPSSLGVCKREKVEVIIIQNWGFIGKMSMKTNGMKKVKMFCESSWRDGQWNLTWRGGVCED